MTSRIVKTSIGRTRQLGLSLVELMVSILIGLIVLAGVVQVMVSSKTMYLGQEDMSFIQENARYALDVIGRDLQNAGHWGCAGSNSTVAFALEVTDEQRILLGDSTTGLQPVMGFTDANHPDLYRDDIRTPEGDLVNEPGNTAPARPTPDSFIVRRAEGPEVPIVNHANSAIVLAAATPGISDSRALVGVAEDCQRVGIFGAGEVNNAVISYAACASLKPSRGGSHDCANPGPYEQFLPGSTIMPLASHAYYVGNSTLLQGQPALKRRALGNGTAIEEEIALGVEDMMISYGVDTNGDGHPDEYVAADDAVFTGDPSNWSRVYAVQVNLVFRSQGGNLADGTDARTILGRNYSDRFARQVVSSTFRLRNRF